MRESCSLKHFYVPQCEHFTSNRNPGRNDLFSAVCFPILCTRPSSHSSTAAEKCTGQQRRVCCFCCQTSSTSYNFLLSSFDFFLLSAKEQVLKNQSLKLPIFQVVVQENSDNKHLSLVSRGLSLCLVEFKVERKECFDPIAIKQVFLPIINENVFLEKDVTSLN